jgi:nucleotide-binding universal stress UspA family protein
MIEKMVVPLDGSLLAEAILPQIRRVLYRNDSEVILVYAVEPPAVESSMPMVEAQLGAAREYLMAQLERLEQSGVRVKQVVRMGSPARVILEVVEEQKATMIALATHGFSGVKRFLFGSVAEEIVRKSLVPVLLLRPFWSYELASAGNPEHRPIRNLLLAVDGSDRSLAALPSAIELAGLFRARVVLLRVLDEMKGEADAGTERAEAENQLREMAKTIEKRGVETLSLVERGDAVKNILNTVRFHNIDLIAMTTHGRTGLARAVAGSITEQVLRHATVPVLVTRNPGIGTPKEAIPGRKTGLNAGSSR